MASLLPFLARGLVTAGTGYLQGQQQGQEDQRRRRREDLADLVARAAYERQQTLAQQQDADRQRAQAIEGAQLAENGVYLGTAPTVTPPRTLQGPLGAVVDRLPTPENAPDRYTQLPGAYLDRTQTPEARATRQFERQQQAAQAAADRAEQVRLFLARMQANQQAAALAGQNARADATLAETSRHNRAMEARPVPGGAAVARLGMPSQGERQVAMLLPAIASGRRLLEQYDDPTVLQRLASRGGVFGNYLNTPEGRQFAQAADQYVQNMIYAKSGKAVTETEARRLWNVYIPMPGDDDATLAQKRQARALDEQAVRIGAGRAAGQADAVGGSGADAPRRPGAIQSPADLWEALRARGMSPAQATAEVQAMLGGG